MENDEKNEANRNNLFNVVRYDEECWHELPYSQRNCVIDHNVGDDRDDPASRSALSERDNIFERRLV